MEIRSGSELGIKNIQTPSEAMKQKRTENPANIPGSDYSNRALEQSEKGASAIKASETRDYYKVLGSTVDMMG